MPMAFHLLPVAAYTGAATITPCKNDQVERCFARDGERTKRKKVDSLSDG